MNTNNETTAYELQESIRQKFSKTISLTTVKSARRGQGWRYERVKYAQFVRMENRPKQVTWCEDAVSSGEQFLDVVFTDETTVQLEQHRRIAYSYRANRSRIIRSRVKYPVKVKFTFSKTS